MESANGWQNEIIPFGINMRNRRIRFGILCNLLFFALSNAIGQITVTNTNATGAGSLAQAIQNAYSAGGAQTIQFNITPLAPPYVISLTNINLYAGSLTSLVIDGSTQPDYVSGQPVIVLNGDGSRNGFDVQMSNVTLRGLNLQHYQTGYSQTSGTNNTIEGCWFGLDYTGIAGVGFQNNAISIKSGTITIGSKTDFSTKTRNVVSNAGLAGILLDGAASGSYIGNNFVGTDATGTVGVGNGFTAPITPEDRHGIFVNNTKSVTIKKNLISANASGGIDFQGNSPSSTIVGNKVGTDVTGLKPLGNRAFGIRVKGPYGANAANNSDGHVIGGTAKADRNIISANGSSDYTFASPNNDPLKFDWNNACGIYIFNSNSSQVIGNYIGVDSTGNSYTFATAYDMGNLYSGLKIDGTSKNNKVGVVNGGNIFGGNGFRSAIEAAAQGLSSLLYGHGMIIKDNSTSGTTVIANRVGVGADGISKIGNKQDGVSVQGAANTTIGGPTAAERNIIGDNTWGIFIASNYYDSQASNVVIYGNYIGVGANGTIAIGNGTRADLNSGGGIGIVHNTSGTLIGGAGTGQGNVVSGNRVGIALMGNSPISPNGAGSTLAKVYGNVIGLNAAGNTSVPNTDNGLYLSQGTNNNSIGGALAGQPNTIVGNLGSGIYLDDALTNTIQGNTLTNNGQTGMTLANNSAGNSVFGNTIGSLTDATKANTGDGIALTTGSNGNLLGGINAGEGNIIGNNTGNGISMLGTTTKQNAIHKNQIACNGLRGIELNKTANGGYAKPTFSGTPTSVSVNATTGAFVEVYTLDGCNTCASGTNTNLQGKTLFTSGTVVAGKFTFTGTAGVTYTATVSERGTDAPVHNTSEFSDCYSLCPPVTTTLTVAGDSVCQGNNAKVTIKASQSISYQAYIGSIAVGSAVSGPGDITLTIPVASLKVGDNIVSFKGTSGVGCIPVRLRDSVHVYLNPVLNANLAVSGDSICSGTDGKVSIQASQAITYQAYKGKTPIGAATDGPGNITLSIPYTSLATGDNIIWVQGIPKGLGCTSFRLKDSVNVYLNPAVNINLKVRGDTVCENSPANVKILASQSMTYQAYLKGVAIGVSVKGPGDITLTIPAANLVTGVNKITFKGLPTGHGCLPVPLKDTAVVVVNTAPKTDSDISTNSPVCTGVQGKLTVISSEVGKTYQVFDENGKSVSAQVTSPKDGSLVINLATTIPVGSHILTVKANVKGCSGTYTLQKTAPFVVNKGIDNSLGLRYVDTICLGTASSITILKTEAGVVYQAYEGINDTVLSTPVTGDGSDKVVNLKTLSEGTHHVYFTAKIGGCAPGVLNDTATIVVNTDVKKTLTVSATTPICLGDTSLVTIQKSEATKRYQVFEKLTAVSVIKSGNGGDLVIPVPNLKEGDHVFTIHVTVPGCKSDTLLQNPFTRVNSAPDSTLKVGTNGPVCGGNQALFYILKPQAGKKYQVFNNGDSVSVAMSGTGDTLKIPLIDLAPGTYNLIAKVSVAGCKAATRLKDGATLVINSVGRTDLDVKITSPICLGDSAIVTVVKAELNKSYQVFYKGKSISDAKSGLGNGTDLDLVAKTQSFSSGTYQFAIGIGVPGCKYDTLAEEPFLTIHKSPNDSLAVSALISPVCVNSPSGVVITGIEPNVSYQAFIGNTNAVSDSLSGPGPNITLPIAASKLSVGWNNVSVKASISGCATVNLRDTAGIKVNPGPRLDMAMSVDPAEICAGSNSTLTIASSDEGVSYQAWVGTQIVSNAVIGDGGSVKLKLRDLPQGVDVVKVKASIGGCADADLDSTVTVKVNNGAKVDYAVTGDTVCKGESATVTIQGSEVGPVYQAFLLSTGDSVSGKIPGTGQAIVLPIQASTHPIDTIVIRAYVTGCGLIDLDNNAIVVTNDNSTSRYLSTRGSSVCMNDPTAFASILMAKSGITYQAWKGTSLLGSLVGKGDTLVFSIPVSSLSSGANTISFVATVPGCDPVALDSSAIIYILGAAKNIDGDALVCDSSQETYSIDPIPGVTQYDWTVPAEASILSGQGTSTITVVFGTQSGNITVSPVGNIGECNSLTSNLFVDVEPHLKEKIAISGLDTVCIHDNDRIYIDSTHIQGVDYVSWTWSNGIQIKDTIYKTAVFPFYDVNYFQAGTQIITATPHEKCSDKMGATDTLIVKVLDKPVAEAGPSIVVLNDLVNTIPLNGKGSSVNGAPPADSLQYTWYSYDKQLQINNPNVLTGASVQPLAGDFVVYLTVTNRKRCPATDTMHLTVKADIVIPNVFSPNNDGTHDTWDIKNLNNIYPNATVEVFNQWGSLIFKSTGYSKPWDGTRNGEEMPVATYYYVIDFKNGSKPNVSSVTLLR